MQILTPFRKEILYVIHGLVRDNILFSQNVSLKKITKYEQKVSNREVFKIGITTYKEKSVQHLFKGLLFLIYWDCAQSIYTKMELKYHSFGKIKKKLKKIIFEHFFRTRKLEKSVFEDQRSRSKFSKKSRKFANRPAEVGQGSESTQIYFFGLQDVSAVKMSHIPASCDHF